MKLTKMILGLSSLLGLSTLALHVQASTDYIQIKQNQRIIADAVRVDRLEQLQLVLNNQQGIAIKNLMPFKKLFPSVS